MTWHSTVQQLSAGLAKKALHQTLVVVATQNLLMKKLGIISSVKVDAGDLEHYLRL
jgi:hypothetical protein